MPKREATTTKKQPTKPIAPEPPPKPVVDETTGLPVLYDKLEIAEYSTASKKGPLTSTDWKDVLGWETEKEYQKRMCAEEPGSKPEAWLFGDVFHCRNLNGEKVRCNNNAQNRPFDEAWSEALIHTILYGQWAGPFTIPGGTVNGETVRISRYGRVLSGQHQGTACILAGEWLAKARADGSDHAANPKYPVWAKHAEPFIETIVVKGMSEDSRVLMTVDYNKPRSAADVFYTSEVFREATPPERKELCRTLATGVDMLWARTETKGYKTHPEIVGFLERHKSLLKCVEYIFQVNGGGLEGRKLSKLRLSHGVCAAVSYLMGCGASDGDAYRNPDAEGRVPPSEKGLDWSYWDRQEEFWDGLASAQDFIPVRQALVNLGDSSPSNPNNQGLGGRIPEKLAILARAWDQYRACNGQVPFTDADLAKGGCLCLSYSDLDSKGNKLPDNEITLLDVADFYGIDCPPKQSEAGDPPEPSREEIWGKDPEPEATAKLREAAAARRK